MNPNPQNFQNAYRNFQSGKFDANASTFRHEINLVPSEKVPVIKGYSASVGTREAVNKVYLFTSCLYRILPKYLHKSISILIYKRHDLTRGWDKANETLICRITKKEVQMYVDEHTPVETVSQKFDSPLDFLTELVAHINEADYVARLKPKQVKPNNMEKYYHELLSNKAFETLEEVTAYCKNRIAEGEARGIMGDFWREYKSAYFSETLSTHPEAHPKVQSEPSTMREQVASFAESITKVVDFSKQPLPAHEAKVLDIQLDDSENEFIAYFAQTMGFSEAQALAQRGSAQYNMLYQNFLTMQKKEGNA